MAAPRRNRSHPDDPASEKTRKSIQTTQLVKRLTCHALGTKDDAGNDVDLNPSQVQAINILIKKTIPDLTATTLSGPDGGPVMPVLTVAGVTTTK